MEPQAVRKELEEKPKIIPRTNWSTRWEAWVEIYARATIPKGTNKKAGRQVERMVAGNRDRLIA